MMVNEFFKRVVSEKELPANFVRFYAVGLLLFILPFTREFFIEITAPSILLVVLAVFNHHKNWDLKTAVIFSFIATSSFGVEAFGVSSGVLFGSYQYNTGLGVKLFDTPLIIGINWLFLVYASNSIAGRVTHKAVPRVALGALLMVAYDLIMELVAPVMDMWHFDTTYPPTINFIAWFLMAVIFHSVLAAFKIDCNNRPARYLFATQLLFFVVISLYSILFIR